MVVVVGRGQEGKFKQGLTGQGGPGPQVRGRWGPVQLLRMGSAVSLWDWNHSGPGSRVILMPLLNYCDYPPREGSEKGAYVLCL